MPISGFEQYRPLGRRALWARVALAAMAAVDFMAVFVDLHEYVLFVRLETEDVLLSELEASDTRRIIVGVTQLAVLTATSFFFIRWLHDAYRNLRALGAGNLRYATATAVWSWFVPILNLWRPKQVVNDVWRASGPDAPDDQSDGAWWGTRVPISSPPDGRSGSFSTSRTTWTTGSMRGRRRSRSCSSRRRSPPRWTG